MRNKGFTLIELLAVIVILAIIALIATPIVLGIINDSRKSADRETAKLMVSNFELAYNAAYMQKSGVEPSLTEIKDKFNMDGLDSGYPQIPTTGADAGKLVIVSKSKNVICKTGAVGTDTVPGVVLTCEITGDSEFNSGTEGVSRGITVKGLN